MRYRINKITLTAILITMLYSYSEETSPFGPYRESMQEKIDQYVDFVQKYRKDDTESFLRKIYGLSTQYALDFDIVMKWLYTESRFNPDARSPKGAIGICQLMPQTARLIASIINCPKFNLYDEDDNLILGFAFLSLLLEECENDYEIALARYYAGPYWSYHLDSKYVKFILQEDICNAGI